MHKQIDRQTDKPTNGNFDPELKKLYKGLYLKKNIFRRFQKSFQNQKQNNWTLNDQNDSKIGQNVLQEISISK